MVANLRRTLTQKSRISHDLNWAYLLEMIGRPQNDSTANLGTVIMPNFPITWYSRLFSCPIQTGPSGICPNVQSTPGAHLQVVWDKHAKLNKLISVDDLYLYKLMALGSTTKIEIYTSFCAFSP